MMPIITGLLPSGLMQEIGSSKLIFGSQFSDLMSQAQLLLTLHYSLRRVIFLASVDLVVNSTHNALPANQSRTWPSYLYPAYTNTF